MKKTFLCILLTFQMLSNANASLFLLQQYPEKLQQTVTKIFPEDTKAYSSPEYIAMVKDSKANAVIVKGDNADSDHIALVIQKKLKNSWGREFPIVDWENAKHSNSNLILFGHVNSNTPLRQLNANAILGNNTFGYELRTIPNALDWKRDVIFLGGNQVKDINEALEVLLVKVKNPAKIPFMISCKGWEKAPGEKEVSDMVAGLKSHFEKDDSNRSQLAIRDLLKEPVYAYKMTGNDAYVKAFAEMQKILFKNYGRVNSGRLETAPSFVFHLYPQYLYIVENSKAFSAEDRLKGAEFIRKMVEEMMVHWEMKDPLILYKESRKDYLTNHSCFASRSVSSSARYLFSRYHYAPAKFWIAVADNGFDGVAPHPFSPEDAAGYQYLVYDIFVDYALASGRYDLGFFKNSAFSDYLKYAKFQINHLGYTAGFGDAYPIGHNSAYPLLRQSMDILGDKEAEYIIGLIEKRSPNLVSGLKKNRNEDLPAPGKHTLGFNYQNVVPFKQQQYEVGNYYKLPLLDKGVFRSGWDSKADFLSVTGINGDGYNHSHFDASGISQYISGDRVWLWEGDYIKKFPNDHNSIVVNRNGKIIDQSRELAKRRKSSLSQVTAAVNNKERSFSLLSMLLEDYNGVNWTRNINYAAKNGFWVIDELDVQEDGNYISESYWRSAGKMVPMGQSVKFIQKKSDDKDIANHFFITEGNGASQLTKTVFEAGHGRKDGNLSGYKFSDLNTRYIIQRLHGNYKKGDKQLFVNFLQAIPGGDPKAPVIKKITPSVFLAESNNVLRLAVINSYNTDPINITADACFIGPEGIVARGATRIKIGTLDWKSENKTNIALDLPTDFSSVQLQKILSKVVSGGSIIKPKPTTNVDVENGKINNKTTHTSNITASGAADHNFAIGAKDGTFSITDDKGAILASHKFLSAISAISSVKTPSGLFWAVATVPEDLKIGEGNVHFLNTKAEVLWKAPIPMYHKRNGVINTLFTANLGQQNSSAIIAGSESWWYYAFSITGKQIWRQPIFHGATVGAAGDMDGNGIDDIAAGGEYYYHSIIQNGKILPHETTSPWNYSAVITDLNNDGLKEAIYGRGDGYLYTQTIDKNPFKPWRLNVGGTPTAIVPIENQFAKIAVSNELGDIVFVDGDGKSTKLIHLPAALVDMKLWKDKLLAVAMDGYVYSVNLNGDILSKYAYAFDINSIYKPKIAITRNSAMVFSGNKIYIIN
jgi:hypothetical protein